ncbi:hypothetical protein ACQ4LE_010583 [Meloidogyne hapla]|uniref:L-dopachrome isomerase n=1 Tax=Meloidogyne hapla TaxID=6305 RepID=A0A1I8B5B5_MELHA
MPVLQVFTNISKESVPPKFTKIASENVASLTGKPESYVMVLVNAGNDGYFGGSNDPFIYAELQSIGGFNDPNKVTGTMTKLFTEHFCVNGGRVYMKLTNPDASKFAHNGKTFG